MLSDVFFFSSDYFAVRGQAMLMVKGKVASTQKRKGREYKEVSRLAEKASPKREEEETPVGWASQLWIQPAGINRRKKLSPLCPHLCLVQGGSSRGCWIAGRSVGGIRVNAARAFCGGGHRRRSCSILPTSISLRERKKSISGHHNEVFHTTRFHSSSRETSSSTPLFGAAAQDHQVSAGLPHSSSRDRNLKGVSLWLPQHQPLVPYYTLFFHVSDMELASNIRH